MKYPVYYGQYFFTSSFKSFDMITNLLMKAGPSLINGFVWNRSLQNLVKRKTLELNDELTGKKTAAEALKESEEKFRAIFEQASM